VTGSGSFLFFFITRTISMTRVWIIPMLVYYS
jgi:hypothetical protein